VRLVRKARAVTLRVGDEIPPRPSEVRLLAAERRYLGRLEVLLQEPTSTRLERARHAASALKVAFAQVRKRSGVVSVHGIEELIAWATAQLQPPPAAAATPAAPPAGPQVVLPDITATPTPTPGAVETPTIEPLEAPSPEPTTSPDGTD
jgi:hypothetical protein